MSNEFKDLYYKMILFNYNNRPNIDEILNHNWFNEIKNMNNEELKELENEIKEEFKKREIKIEECTKIELIKKNEENNNNNTRSINDENNFFENNIKPKYLKNINNINYYIKIKGNINPIKFMNSLCHKIFKEFGIDNCFIDINKNKLKFNVTFDVNEELKKEIPEKIKNELNKLNINDEIKEDEENNVLTIKVKLYEIDEGHLIKFIKKEGNKIDFIDKFETLTKYVKSLI